MSSFFARLLETMVPSPVEDKALKTSQEQQN